MVVGRVILLTENATQAKLYGSTYVGVFSGVCSVTGLETTRCTDRQGETNTFITGNNNNKNVFRGMWENETRWGWGAVGAENHERIR